jgi:predicted Zn-dependent protease
LPAVEFLATHPLTANRVDAVRRWASDQGRPIEGPRRPLTGVLAQVRDEVEAERRQVEQEKLKRKQ